MNKYRLITFLYYMILDDVYLCLAYRYIEMLNIISIYRSRAKISKFHFVWLGEAIRGMQRSNSKKNFHKIHQTVI